MTVSVRLQLKEKHLSKTYYNNINAPCIEKIIKNMHFLLTDSRAHFIQNYIYNVYMTVKENFMEVGHNDH